MKTKVFTGKWFPGAVKRRISSPDPLDESKAISTTVNLSMVTGLVLERVSGHGESAKGTGFSNTGEDFVTVNGQYAPGGTKRITVSAQNVHPFAEKLLKGNLDKEGNLAKEYVVTAIGTEARGNALMVHELYLENEDGTKTAVIAAQEQAVEESLADVLL